MFKTIKCKYCGKQLAADASGCPNCGTNNPKQSASEKIYSFVVAIIIMAVLFAMFD